MHTRTYTHEPQKWSGLCLGSHVGLVLVGPALSCLLSHQVEGDQLPTGHTVSQYETCKIRTIKAGTLEKLVENLLTAFGDNDFTYISIFLSTFRGFASTTEVLELLLDR